MNTIVIVQKHINNPLHHLIFMASLIVIIDRQFTRRSEERRVGKEGLRLWRTRWWPDA